MKNLDVWGTFEKEFNQPVPYEQIEKYVAKNARILEVGCGYGRVLNRLMNLGYVDLTGIDASVGMIARGKKQFPKLQDKISLHQTEALPFENENFDAVILVGVLTCVVDKTKQEKLLAEIKRVLKPKGILCVGDFIIADDEHNQNRYKAYMAKGRDDFGVFECTMDTRFRHHSVEYLTKLLKDFDIVWQEEQEIISALNGAVDKVISIIVRFR